MVMQDYVQHGLTQTLRMVCRCSIVEFSETLWSFEIEFNLLN